MALSFRTWALLMVTAAYASACTPTAGSSSGTSGPQGDAGTTAATPPSPLSCSAIFTCAAACPDTDEACSDKCLAQGSPAAQSAANAVATCFTDHGCQDAECFKANCPSELQACVDSAKSGTSVPLTGAAPTGSVPSEMIGKWAARDVIWEFFADGTAKRLTEGKVGGCRSQRLESGSAVAAGATLTVYFTTTKVTICDAPGNSSNYQPNSEAFTWRAGKTTDGHPTLFLQETKCRYDDPKAAEFYCGTAFDKID